MLSFAPADPPVPTITGKHSSVNESKKNNSLPRLVVAKINYILCLMKDLKNIFCYRYEGIIPYIAK